MIVLVDMDGVLCGYAQRFDVLFQQRYPDGPFVPSSEHTQFKLHHAYPPEWKERVGAIQSEAGFFASLEPLPGAVEGITALAAAGHEVFICTAPLKANQSCASEKMEWVAAHLGAQWLDRVVITSDKTLVRGDVLIDDNPTVEGSMAPSWTHLLFDAPYSRGLGREVVTWETIPAALAALAGEGPLVHGRGNAEDCPVCQHENPPYPFLCRQACTCAPGTASSVFRPGCPSHDPVMARGVAQPVT